jgi:hypothetical protein
MTEKQKTSDPTKPAKAGETRGQAIVQPMVGDLQREFPDVGGFSASNLWRMKAIHEACCASEKLAPVAREIAWNRNLIILERCSDPLEREFYLRMTRKFGWSKNVLTHQIATQSYEKSLLGHTSFDKAPANKLIGEATCEIVKHLPKALKGQLPSPEQVAKILGERI